MLSLNFLPGMNVLFQRCGCEAFGCIANVSI